MVTDEALMLDFQRGSRESFEELFYRYRQPLYGFFRRRLASPERAQDLTQETFLAVLRARTRYKPQAAFKSYLYGIAFHLLSSERRKDAVHPQPLDTEPDPAHAADTALWVRQALQQLDASEREILMLREYEQLSYAEIAGLLRLPINTVRSRLFRSRIALKAYLEPAARATEDRN